MERSGTPGTADRRTTARVAADSAEVSKHYRPPRGLEHYSWILTWGSAALHPRLYAVDRYRGLGLSINHASLSHLNLDFLSKALAMVLCSSLLAFDSHSKSDILIALG